MIRLGESSWVDVVWAFMVARRGSTGDVGLSMQGEFAHHPRANWAPIVGTQLAHAFLDITFCYYIMLLFSVARNSILLLVFDMCCNRASIASMPR